jgi:hypothetical protein
MRIVGIVQTFCLLHLDTSKSLAEPVQFAVNPIQLNTKG